MNHLNKKREGAVNKRVLIIILAVLVLVLLGEAVFLFAVSDKSSSNKDVLTQTEVATPVPSVIPEPMETPIVTISPSLEPLVSEEPTPEPTEEPTPTPEDVTNGYIVAIDAGHQRYGNSDTEPIGPGSSTVKAKVSDGATGTSSGVPEYQLNLIVAKRLKRELKIRGYRVYMIRKTNDVDISNVERAQAANESGADICVRLHADGIEDSSVTGASALYPSPDNPYIPELSKKCEKLSNAILDAYCSRTGIRNRGLSLRDDLTGTNWSKIPVTLLEMGFLSNPSEDEMMNDPGFQKTMVKGIADGIDRFFGI